MKDVIASDVEDGEFTDTCIVNINKKLCLIINSLYFPSFSLQRDKHCMRLPWSVCDGARNIMFISFLFFMKLYLCTNCR
ncbi:hypothetical protein H9660_09615 [Clostridium sp. Sa3CUN1]|uniref:Uncharacterized protein n=1 Tax=Clostridium gallinarum TaxID=2762246 RepID=A0ABR8Q4T1_9CLOT|nr:hypothetical protein [Clostridium gallinarum]